MSDETIRRLEREAARDPSASVLASLARVRCRVLGHGSDVDVRGTQNEFAIIRGVPEITVVSAQCAACREPVDIPDARLIRFAIKHDGLVEATTGRFSVRVAVDCRSGHMFDNGALYMRFDELQFLASGSLTGAVPFRRCVRCGAEA